MKIGFPVQRIRIARQSAEAFRQHCTDPVGSATGSPDVPLEPTTGECPICHGHLLIARGSNGRCVAVEQEEPDMFVMIDPMPATLECVTCMECDVTYWRPKTQ